ncbi:hypothetical protein ACIQWL_52460 [Streptomyces mirabilis]|uniref:hypothetical protein n=1 Tax=Streptomyces mirabilis TaxID=68239 RepID=UPI0037FE045E
MASTTSDDRASRSLSAVGPSANSRVSTEFTATSPHAAVTPCPSCATTTPAIARRSVSQPVRSTMPTMRGSAAAMCPNESLVSGPSWRT